MKKAFLPVFLFMMLVLSGCGPQLAQSPYGPAEEEWEKYLKKSYPAWTPPKTIPPTSTGEESQLESVEVKEDIVLDTVQPIVQPEISDEPDLLKMNEDPVLSMPEEEPVLMNEVAPPLLAKDAELYTVEKGDNLWKIADKVYQSGNKWKRIYEANKDILPEPNKLKPGMQLRIPRD